jgi:hypothetical protein
MKASAVASIEPRRFASIQLALTGGVHATPAAAAADFHFETKRKHQHGTSVFSSVVYASLGAKRLRLFSLFRTSEKIAKQVKAFDLLVNFWSERRDLNSGPPVPQTGALTGLRYAPNGADYSDWG